MSAQLARTNPQQQSPQIQGQSRMGQLAIKERWQAMMLVMCLFFLAFVCGWGLMGGSFINGNCSAQIN